MNKRRWSVRIASVVLCAGLTMNCALAAQDSCPAWAMDAAERWAACEKLDREMDYGHVLTRGELAVMLDSVLDLEAYTGAGFSDLTGEADVDGAVCRLAQAGVLSADADGRIWPARQVTRQEAAVMLAKAFDLTAQGAADYSDAGAIAPWAADAVAALQQAGVMSGSGGAFCPEDGMTYAQALQAVTNALDATGVVTGMTAQVRSEEGVLVEGSVAHVNDGKFEITGVTATEDGFAVELQGLDALVGQQADADGTGRPEWAGKWMGVRLSFTGLVCMDDYQYSQDGRQWISLEMDSSIPQEDRASSVMVYINGAQTPDADAPEVEKTSTVIFRHSQSGESFTVSFHYTPKA